MDQKKPKPAKPDWIKAKRRVMLDKLPKRPSAKLLKRAFDMNRP